MDSGCFFGRTCQENLLISRFGRMKEMTQGRVQFLCVDGRVNYPRGSQTSSVHGTLSISRCPPRPEEIPDSFHLYGTDG